MRVSLVTLAPLLFATSFAAACGEAATTTRATPDAPDADTNETDAAAAEPTVVAGHTGELFGETTSSYAKLDADGVVVAVGVTVPLAAFTAAPPGHAFQDDLVLEMPEVAIEQTIVHQLRVNWLSGGHGPDPYGKAHFDLHFLRGSVDEVDAIDCKDRRMPASALLPAGYATPELCVPAMGFHSWPEADVNGGAFSASLIMGYYAAKVVFLEPMIAKSMLTAKESFEMAIPKPTSAGGASTLYPTRMKAIWSDDDQAYAFELDQLEPID